MKEDEQLLDLHWIQKLGKEQSHKILRELVYRIPEKEKEALKYGKNKYLNSPLRIKYLALFRKGKSNLQIIKELEGNVALLSFMGMEEIMKKYLKAFPWRKYVDEGRI